jgi:beta-lactamase class A
MLTRRRFAAAAAAGIFSLDISAAKNANAFAPSLDLVLGNQLSAASRKQLTTWLLGNRTGDARLRAGLPAGWQCGDKTGSGERGSTNDIGLVWPPQQRQPVIVTIYLTDTAAEPDARNKTIADVGRAIAAAL